MDTKTPYLNGKSSPGSGSKIVYDNTIDQDITGVESTSRHQSKSMMSQHIPGSSHILISNNEGSKANIHGRHNDQRIQIHINNDKNRLKKEKIKLNEVVLPNGSIINVSE